MKLLLPYLIIINALGALLMMVDKHRARKKMRRIDERNFFLTAIFGGCPGIMMGVYVARHKTRHKSFTIGVPLILSLQIIAFILWIML